MFKHLDFWYMKLDFKVCKRKVVPVSSSYASTDTVVAVVSTVNGTFLTTNVNPVHCLPRREGKISSFRKKLKFWIGHQVCSGRSKKKEGKNTANQVYEGERNLS